MLGQVIPRMFLKLLLSLRNAKELHFVRNERIHFLEVLLPSMIEATRQERKTGEISRTLILTFISWIQLYIKLVDWFVCLFIYLFSNMNLNYVSIFKIGKIFSNNPL